MASKERFSESFDDFDPEKDKFRDACGIVGIYHPGEINVARSVFFGLYALQHRGQESAGIVASSKGQLRVHKDLGLVSQVFREENIKSLIGSSAIGHCRYSNTGSNCIENTQPCIINSEFGEISLAHNGNLINSHELKSKLISSGISDFASTSDSELILKTIASSEGFTLEEKIKNGSQDLIGAYSLVLLTKDKLIGVRDPFGIRPLCLGVYNGDGFVLASETAALDTIGAKHIRELDPGEIVTLSKNGVESNFIDSKKSAFCIFEYIYYARPDSVLENSNYVGLARIEMGKKLAQEQPVNADIVVPVLDSGEFAADGYSHESGIEKVNALVKNRYVGRVFISPDERLRSQGVHIKLNVIRPLVEGKRVVIVDDSIVRGTTTPKVVALFRENGAKEVHVRISSPPIKGHCSLGIDTANPEELIAFQMNSNVERIREAIGADSLGYLSFGGLSEAMGKSLDTYCHGCFSGSYPILTPEKREKLALEV